VLALTFPLPSQASKVAVLGAAGGIGQPLSLLLKLNPRVSELALYDIRGGPGMSQELVLFRSSATSFNCDSAPSHFRIGPADLMR
jgi:malate dehydrogenase